MLGSCEVDGPRGLRDLTNGNDGAGAKGAKACKGRGAVVGRDVHASFSGMKNYAELCRKQEAILGKVEEVVTGSCANFGAFTGFMSMFSGGYRDAQSTVATEISRARSAAADMAANIDATVADFRETDSGVSNDMGKLQVKVTSAPDPGDAPGHPDGPEVPAPIKTANSGASTVADAPDVADHLPQHLPDGLPGRTPTLDDAGIRGLPTDGVEVVTQVTDTIAAGQSIGHAQDDEDTYEDFENRHRKDK